MPGLSAIGTWIGDNSGALNFGVNLAMLAVWILYFQLLWMTYRRQTRPNILINRGPGHDLAASCLVSNMSERPIYIQAVMVTARAGTRSRERMISDMGRHYERAEKPDSLMSEQQQGPLDAGGFVDIGSFQNLLAGLADDGFPIDGVETFEVTVIAVYTARADLIGARRRFAVSRNDGRSGVTSAAIMATQITGSRDKRALLSALS